MKAKTVSLIVKICTCIFIVVCSVLKWIGVFRSATIAEICIVGGTLAGIFGDVSLNLMLEKIGGKKKDVEAVCGAECGGSCGTGDNDCSPFDEESGGCEE